ncbi:type 1 fimbrial protein [Serratia rubidaea]|nr:type 1 fimbrial protein [Serratia rubidaea]
MNGIYTSLLVGAFILAGLNKAQSADVTITVNGRVVAKPCLVSTPTAAVPLGDLYTRDLTAAGAASNWHPVMLTLTNCPIGTSRVTATFSGTADSSGKYYANQGTASHVVLQLEDSEGKELPNGSTHMVAVNDVSQVASFSLKVRAFTSSGNVSSGSIQTVINVTYTYS